MTDFHSAYFAYELTRRHSVQDSEKLASVLADAQLDLNPHQLDAALFVFKSPLSMGSILADEVGLGKTIEAGLVIAQKWSEGKRRIIIITPANLCKLLASSTFAIAGALDSLAKRLKRELKDAKVEAGIIEIEQDYEDYANDAEPMQFICLDKAFGGNDQLKANAVQTFNARNMGKEKHNQIIFRTV